MRGRSLVQTVALAFGIIYLVVGVLGLAPFVGGSYTQTNSNLLGFVPINLLHNVVHLVIGIAGIAAAGSLARSRQFCQVFGVVLILIGIAGIFINNPLNLIPIGGFDVAIHLVTGGILAYFGFVSAAQPRPVVA
jgi:hypothetical protein